MTTILDEIAGYARVRVTQAKQHLPQAVLARLCTELGKSDFGFTQAISGSELAFICECKKASLSKGIIAADFPYLEIARAYEAAGANAISVLTEPKWFCGDDQYLREIASEVTLPCLRKDFVVDEYMIYQARFLGASAVLLICALLDPVQLREYQQLADELGLSALVEVHDSCEVEQALAAGARIIGVNNRNLKDFTVDIGNSASLRELVPEGVLFVAESGIQSAADVAAARKIGADAVLVGEALMRSNNKREKLRILKGECDAECD